ncbi:MAG TPA: ferritin family protein [candidate division Zixibacteria bacterium]|nr:ferritin family protein [candidate division Zixibacteria bacterium]
MQSTTEVIKFAMQMELDGKAFYEKGAAVAVDPAIKDIFKTLAEEEAKHFTIFKSMRDGALEEARAGMAARTQTPKLAKNIFKQLTEAGRDSIAAEGALETWQEAMRVEEKSEKLYRDAADKENDAVLKGLLNTIADEEKNHIYLIENMILFIKDPQGYAASSNYASFMSWEGHSSDEL